MRYPIMSVSLVATLALLGCGNKDESSGTNPLPVEDDIGEDTGGIDNGGTTEARPIVVRGTWSFDVSTDSSMLFRGTGQTTVPVSIDVPKATTFTINQGNFKPTVGEAATSFGTLDVKSLSDNSLRVCGTSGTQRCTKALIRVYTTGADGAGLWNALDAFGLPITSTDKVIGLNVAGAHIVKEISIPALQRTVKLSHFGGAVSVPVSVDFTDATAGTYATTLVVEYALQ